MDSDFQNPNTINGSATVTGNLSVGGNLVTSGSATVDGNVMFVGQLTEYHGQTLAGVGMAYIIYDSGTATTASTVTLTYTPPAQAGMYRLSIWSKNTTGTSCICSLAYTDETGSAVAAATIPFWTLGAAGGVLTMNTAGDDYSGEWTFHTDNSGTNILIKFALTTTTIVYRVIMERIG